MKKSVFLLILLGLFLQVSAQRKSQIQLTSSTKVKGIGVNSLGRFIRPVFTQDGSTLAADSADFNQAANAFDAYGHVVITQPNGTVIYSDLLNYDGNSRVAILTNNVKMIDKDATLTTNHLTYNMGTKIGTYIGGGKIENAQNIITSQNGYYFETSRDAYFRNDVTVNTPESLIKNDTLKYNTESKMAWFFGPTNIYGKGGKKNSKLYTENGNYNTVTDQAWFGKKNLYTEDSKKLKGDSLYYDGKAGFGKAINNITFVDTVEKIVLKGDLGIYRRIDASCLVTKNAYVEIEAKQDSGKVDTIWMAADTLITKQITMKQFVSATNEKLKSDNEVIETGGDDVEIEGVSVEGQPGPVRVPTSSKPTANNLISENGMAADNAKTAALKGKQKKKKKKGKGEDQAETTAQEIKEDPVVVALRSMQLQARGDSLAKTGGLFFKPRVDSIIAKRFKEYMKNPANFSAKKAVVKPFDPRDTMKTRVLYAFHDVKIFKSDLQSRSDSAFYSYADSIIRMYKKPIIWTQGSQLTADTIYLQMKNQKLDNMLLQTNGFVASAEGDSTKFNQVKGKVITGLFTDSKLTSMSVDGNAESVYFSVDSLKNYTGMNRSLSSRMRLTFGDSKLKQVMFVRKPEGKYYPIEHLPADIDILDGFIWKPKERPRSKEEIIPSLRRKKQASKAVPKKASVSPAKGTKAVKSLTAKPPAATATSPKTTEVKKEVSPQQAPKAVSKTNAAPTESKPELKAK